jgi:hypothetical protein
MKKNIRKNLDMNANEHNAQRSALIAALNAPCKEDRLSALKALIAFENENGLNPIKRENDSNNHIHTIYSFSPYSPTAAA